MATNALKVSSSKAAPIAAPGRASSHSTGATTLPNASPGNRHALWLTERMAAWHYANAGRTDAECNERIHRVYEIEDRILDTPALNVAEALCKLKLLAIHHDEQALIDTSRVHDVIAEIVPTLLRGGLN